jgi:transcriptional regulator with XRE-family HTH domain
MVWQVIRSLRLKRNLSQEYLAAQLDITQKTYSRLESGQTRLTIEWLMKIADILEEHPLDLLMDAYPDLNRKSGGAADKQVRQHADNDEREAMALLRLKLDYDRLLNEALVKGLQQSAQLIERLCRTLEAQEQRFQSGGEGEKMNIAV